MGKSEDLKLAIVECVNVMLRAASPTLLGNRYQFLNNNIRQCGGAVQFFCRLRALSPAPGT